MDRRFRAKIIISVRGYLARTHWILIDLHLNCSVPGVANERISAMVSSGPKFA